MTIAVILCIDMGEWLGSYALAGIGRVTLHYIHTFNILINDELEDRESWKGMDMRRNFSSGDERTFTREVGKGDLCTFLVMQIDFATGKLEQREKGQEGAAGGRCGRYLRFERGDGKVSVGE